MQFSQRRALSRDMGTFLAPGRTVMDPEINKQKHSVGGTRADGVPGHTTYESWKKGKPGQHGEAL